MLQPLDTFVDVRMTSADPLQFTIYRKRPQDSNFETILTDSRDVVWKWVQERELKPLYGTTVWVGTCELRQEPEPLPHLDGYGSIDRQLSRKSINCNNLSTQLEA